MEAFGTLENKLKAGTAILGIFSLGLTAGSYGEGNSSDEFALAMVIIAFMFSLGLVICLLLKLLPTSVMFQRIEMVTHLVLAILLAIGWLIFVINTAKWGGSRGWKATRSFALIFSGINDVIYGFIAFTIFRQSQG